jgi:Alkaline phosphatase
MAISNIPISPSGGQRLDEDLLLAYERMRQHHNQTYKIVKTKQELAAVNASTKFLLGLFADSHLEYEVDKQVDKNTKVKDQPSLTEMTQKAIEVLSKNQNGFYLFVEGEKLNSFERECLSQMRLPAYK